MTKHNKITERHRCPAVIEMVKPEPVDNEHGGWSIWIDLHYDEGGTQGLTGWHVDKPIAREALKEICRLFRVAKPADLVGKRCYGLKELGGHNEYLCGIESADTGERFLTRPFLRKYYPETNNGSRLAELQDSVRNTIAWAERRKREAEQELAELPRRFVDWEKA